jgi:asparagine synthase (glutamine-hydrolysing)
MCGIAGWLATPKGHEPSAHARMDEALQRLSQRGPDHQAYIESGPLLLGHARLSILDLSTAAHQPMRDPTGRYFLAFNGEIFNFQTLRSELESAGLVFHTGADTEVLLHLLIREGAQCLNRLNGFFAFSFYDAEVQKLTLARDRYGIKPLVYYRGNDGLRFASEIKALLALGMPAELDQTSLLAFLSLNYLPPDKSMLKGVEKLPPGYYLEATSTNSEVRPWYQWPRARGEYHPERVPSFPEAQKQLADLLEDSVRLRLIADVPVGVFLSGGIDSSVIATLAARHTNHLHTFSISFQDPLYDETQYAMAVAKRIKSEHTVFRVTYDDLSAAIEPVLSYLDEPFADASALNFYVLSHQTRQRVTVALSGDGADELFGGYSKHQGEFIARNPGLKGLALKAASPILGLLPSHRNSPFARKVWQARKLLAGWQASPDERFLRWCMATPVEEAKLLLKNDTEQAGLARFAAGIKADPNDYNRVLEADLQLVLTGDMLVKVDLMSMANSLEVRVPFLDYRLVEFASGLPASYKVNAQMRKRILQDAFRPILPAELYNRPKQGFEVPLAGWLAGPLRPMVERELLDRDRIEAQGLFRFEAIEKLYKAVLEGRNGKEDWTLWALLVFQRWYHRVLGDSHQNAPLETLHQHQP